MLENKEKLETTLEKLRVAVRKKAKYSKHLEKIIAALNVAQEVQQSLLPQYSPHEDRFDLAGSSQYCDETGGDYYDYINCLSWARMFMPLQLGTSAAMAFHRPC